MASRPVKGSSLGPKPDELYSTLTGRLVGIILLLSFALKSADSTTFR